MKSFNAQVMKQLIQSRRGYLCDLSKKYPDLIDAGYTGYHLFTIAPSFKEEMNKNIKGILTFPQYLAHKYVIDIDGLVASTPGCAWKLLTKSVVFKHDSIYQLHFYSQLKPWVHYIPLNSAISDVLEKISWAMQNDQKAKQIAENGRKFVLENLMPEHIYLYQYKVLKKYASLQKFKPKPLQPLLSK